MRLFEEFKKLFLRDVEMPGSRRRVENPSTSSAKRQKVDQSFFKQLDEIEAKISTFKSALGISQV